MKKKEAMDKTTVQNSASDKPSSEQLKAQLASHLEGQPENIRSFHRVMKVLESISFGIIIIVFIIALVLSFMWKSVPVEAIPTAWLLLPVSAAILMLLIAVHALVLRAFPPSGLFTIFQRGSSIRLPGKSQGFQTGKAAEFTAWGLILVGLIVGAFFSVFAWSAWTVNWTILTPMITVLGGLMGVAIAVSIVGGMILNIYQKVFKSR
jgi:hypothetical protein